MGRYATEIYINLDTVIHRVEKIDLEISSHRWRLS